MTPSADKDLSRKIKEFAHSIGFSLIGIAQSRPLTADKEILNKWAASGMNAEMHFLERDIEKRSDPALLLADAKSVIVAGLSYFHPELQGGNGVPVISRYAYGKDYHIVVAEKLNRLLEFILTCAPSAKGKVCVDTSPIFEKTWAKEAGLGWVGKNSLLINKEKGSFIFLGEIILDIELKYDLPFAEDFCGTCNQCSDECPTNAINENRTIDARKCISWLTVENKNPVPEEYISKMKGRIFGCDICQDACPWNKDLNPEGEPEFKLSDELKKMSSTEWLTLSEDNFKLLFNNSSVRRATYKKLISNIKAVIPDIR
jgi:epoxyqueuosine reductase